MPATKIETGVYIELNRLHLLPNARKHRPDKIASLAQSIHRSNAQLQEIVVCPQDEAAGANSAGFDILAGGGRWEAETQLGWEKGRCTIMFGLSPYEKLKVTLDENKEREETGPLDDARIYLAMSETEKDLSQEQLAGRESLSQERFSQYLTLAKQPVDVQEVIGRPINLGMEHLLQLCRLERREDLVEITEKASNEGWSVKKLTGEVRKRLASPSRQTSGDSPSPKESGSKGNKVDPFATIWSSLKANPGVPHRNWEVKYSRGPVWDFSLNLKGQSLLPTMTRWFQSMATALAAIADNPPVPASTDGSDVAKALNLTPEQTQEFTDRIRQIQAAYLAQHKPIQKVEEKETAENS